MHDSGLADRIGLPPTGDAKRQGKGCGVLKMRSAVAGLAVGVVAVVLPGTALGSVTIGSNLQSTPAFAYNPGSDDVRHFSFDATSS